MVIASATDPANRVQISAVAILRKVMYGSILHRPIKSSCLTPESQAPVTLCCYRTISITHGREFQREVRALPRPWLAYLACAELSGAGTKKPLRLGPCGHLYGLPATGSRFFTVYGQWGRPDMARRLRSKTACENSLLGIGNITADRAWN